jgi:hypothetical protein
MSAKLEIDRIVSSLEERRAELNTRMEVLAAQADAVELQLKAVDRALSKARVLQSDIEEAGVVIPPVTRNGKSGTGMARGSVAGAVAAYLKEQGSPRTAAAIAETTGLRKIQVSAALSGNNHLFAKRPNPDGPYPLWDLVPPNGEPPPA